MFYNGDYNTLEVAEDENINLLIDDDAYEPTYLEAFPPLTYSHISEINDNCNSSNVYHEENTNRHKNKSSHISKCNSTNMRIKSSVVTHIFSVPIEEQRYKEYNDNNSFGNKTNKPYLICNDIMRKTGVAIEISLSRDQSLTIVVTGKPEAVLKAKMLLFSQLQNQTSIQIQIPKEHYPFLLRAHGQKIAQIELASSTKIIIPRKDNPSDLVTIIGTREGVEKARKEIQQISDAQAKLASVNLKIPKVFHAFVYGPYNQVLKSVIEKTNAKIIVPPLTSDGEEIYISGEKEGVKQAVEEITAIYNNKKLTCKTVSVEVKKSQHKFIIGNKGCHINEILQETGVSIDLPPLNLPSETITLFGDPDKLGMALTRLYAKANSFISKQLEIPCWLHRFIIGPKGATIKKLKVEVPKVHIEFLDNKVTIDGPPSDVEIAEQQIKAMSSFLLSKMAFVELILDSKNYQNLKQNNILVFKIKSICQVSIRYLCEDQQTKIIRIEGSPEGVASAKSKILELIEKLENEITRELKIDQKWHKSLIGQHGNKIKEINEKFPSINISIPQISNKNDKITIKGPKKEADQCYKYLQLQTEDLISKNYTAEICISKDLHKAIIGKGGSRIKKICDETETRIDLPGEKSTSDKIILKGKKEKVDEALLKIDTIKKEYENIGEQTIEIPIKLRSNKLHIMKYANNLLASKEMKSSNIQFFYRNNDKIIVKGSKEEIEKLKKHVDEHIASLVSIIEVEITIEKKHHKHFLSNRSHIINELFEKYHVEIFFPKPASKSELVVLTGKQEDIQKTQEEIKKIIFELDSLVTIELCVPKKFHRVILGAKGKRIQDITKEHNVIIQFPKKEIHDNLSEIKTTKSKNKLVKQKVSEETHENNFTTELTNLDDYITKHLKSQKDDHNQDLFVKENGIDANNNFLSTKLFNEKNVNDNSLPINSDDFSLKADVSVVTNGDTKIAIDVDNCSSNKIKDNMIKENIIIIGKSENCEAAKQAMMSYLPITHEISVPIEYHRLIIGPKGDSIRKLMVQFKVNISVPSAFQKSEIIKIEGQTNDVEQASKYLQNKVELYLRDKKFKETSVREEIKIDHRIHPRLIGAKGKSIQKIMKEFSVDIKFPSQNAQDKDIIIVIGQQSDVDNCIEHLSFLEDEYIQIVMDNEVMKEYQSSNLVDRYKTSNGSTLQDKSQKTLNSKNSKLTKGFTVRDAPWSKAPPLNNSDNFPSIFPGIDASISSNHNNLNNVQISEGCNGFNSSTLITSNEIGFTNNVLNSYWKPDKSFTLYNNNNINLK